MYSDADALSVYGHACVMHVQYKAAKFIKAPQVIYIEASPLMPFRI